MKAYKIALLSLALVLPAQELLAGNSSKAKTPAANKQMVPIGAGAAPVSSIPLKNPAIGVVKPSTRRGIERARQSGRTEIRTQLSNLIIESVGWDAELCSAQCPTVAQHLHIAQTLCRIKVRIRNASNVATPTNFRVMVNYADYQGNITRRGLLAVGPIAANGVEEVVMPRLGYFRTDRRVVVEVDTTNIINESNEGDNTATFLPAL